MKWVVEAKHMLLYLVLSVPVIIFILLYIPIANAQLSQAEDELKEVFEKIDALERQINDIERDISNVTIEIENIESEQRDILDDINNIQRNRNESELQLLSLYDEIIEKEEDIRVLQGSLEQQEEEFNSRLRVLYKQGYSSYFQYFLGADSFGDFFTRLSFVARTLRQDAQMINGLKDMSEELMSMKLELEKSVSMIADGENELAEMEQSLILYESQLGDVIREKEGILSKFEQKRNEYEMSVDALMETSQDLEGLIKGLQKPSEDEVGANLSFQWPAEGRISSGFGWRIHPIHGTRRFHSGIDIAIVTGTPVKAWAAGRVIYAGWVQGYGETVIIDHGSEITTLYAHNSVIKCWSGQQVSKGQVIAESGSTGNVTGPHLHFEIRMDGSPVDQIEYLP